jgi:hypothetical protein
MAAAAGTAAAAAAAGAVHATRPTAFIPFTAWGAPDLSAFVRAHAPGPPAAAAAAVGARAAAGESLRADCCGPRIEAIAPRLRRQAAADVAVVVAVTATAVPAGLSEQQQQQQQQQLRWPGYEAAYLPWLPEEGTFSNSSRPKTSLEKHS